jgi:hypothetical protein
VGLEYGILGLACGFTVLGDHTVIWYSLVSPPRIGLRGTVASADGGFRQAVLMRRRHFRLPVPRSSFAGFRFPPEVITVAVRWYLRYGLSYRDVEELLAERGIDVDHVTIYRWVQRFTPLLIDAARPCRHASGDRWFVDETYVKAPAGGTTCTGRSARSTSP